MLQTHWVKQPITTPHSPHRHPSSTPKPHRAWITLASQPPAAFLFVREVWVAAAAGLRKACAPEIVVRQAVSAAATPVFAIPKPTLRIAVPATILAPVVSAQAANALDVPTPPDLLPAVACAALWASAVPTKPAALSAKAAALASAARPVRAAPEVSAVHLARLAVMAPALTPAPIPTTAAFAGMPVWVAKSAATVSAPVCPL